MMMNTVRSDIAQNYSNVLKEFDDGRIHRLPYDMFVSIRMAQCSLVCIGVIILSLIVFNECFLRRKFTKLMRFRVSHYVDQHHQHHVPSDFRSQAFMATYLVLAYSLFIVAVVQSTVHLVKLIIKTKSDKTLQYFIYFSELKLTLMVIALAIFCSFIFIYFPALLLKYYKRHRCLLILAVGFGIIGALCFIFTVGFGVCSAVTLSDHDWTVEATPTADVTIIDGAQINHVVYVRDSGTLGNISQFDILIASVLVPLLEVSTLLLVFAIMLHITQKRKFHKNSLNQKSPELPAPARGSGENATILRRVWNCYTAYVTRLSREIYELQYENKYQRKNNNSKENYMESCGDVGNSVHTCDDVHVVKCMHRSDDVTNNVYTSDDVTTNVHKIDDFVNI